MSDKPSRKIELRLDSPISSSIYASKHSLPAEFERRFVYSFVAVLSVVRRSVAVRKFVFVRFCGDSPRCPLLSKWSFYAGVNLFGGMFYFFI